MPITFTAKLNGADTDYPISTSATWDTSDFNGPAFSAWLSGNNLSGGAN